MENNLLNYNYPIKQFLTKNVNLFADIEEYSQIILCPYKINVSGKYPFLEFLLSNTGYNILTLPVLPIYNSFNKTNLIAYSNVFLSGILQINNFENFVSKIEFDGFHEFSNNLYLFFDLSKCEVDIDDTYSYNPLRFALIDEIINDRRICNMEVNSNTVDFFIKNESINYLYNDKNEAFEIPIVRYVGKPTTEKLNFVHTFGESAKNKSAILGPHFYFTDFINAIRQGGWSHNFKPEYMNSKLITDNEYGRYAKGGIVRFALFTGKTKYIENSPNDPIDESEIKKQRLNDTNLNGNYEMLTLRISDHDGVWSNTYDSVYLGNIELDDGNFLENTSMFVIKNYIQQLPLSYHYIDKNKLGEKFNKDNYSYGIV